MKLKSGFVLREMAVEITVLPAGDHENYDKVVTLNETGAFLWRKLDQEITEEQLLASLLEEYDVDAETAKKHLGLYLAVLKENDLLAD